MVEDTDGAKYMFVRWPGANSINTGHQPCLLGERAGETTGTNQWNPVDVNSQDMAALVASSHISR